MELIDQCLEIIKLCLKPLDQHLIAIIVWYVLWRHKELKKLLDFAVLDLLQLLLHLGFQLFSHFLVDHRCVA